MTTSGNRHFSWALVAAVVPMGLMALSGEYYRPIEERMGGASALYMGLLLAHMVLYGTGPYLRRWSPVLVYVAAQASIVVALGVLSGSLPALLGLVLILTTEGVVITVDRWRPAHVVMGGVGLFVATFLVISGWSEATSALAVMITFGLLVYIANHARRVVAERKFKTLLGEVQDTHRHLARYTSHIEDLTREGERQRMARELHDTLAQGLAGLALQLEAADSQLARDGVARAREIIQGAMEHARASLRGARGAIHDLREPSHTLRGSLEEEVARFEGATTRPCRASFNIRNEPSPEIQFEVLMIVREVLTNVARHASARHVTVDVNVDASCVEIRIEDDGSGFDVDDVSVDSGHYGILGIRERVSKLGGEVRFCPRQPKGTLVHVKVYTDPVDDTA